MFTHHKMPQFLAASAFILTLGAVTAAAASSTGQYIDDATITAKVKAALIADQPLKALQVSVETIRARLS